MRYSRCIRGDLVDLSRATEWWAYKLVPILSAFYATALVLRASILSLWIDALALLVSMTAAAMYASALNELTDRGDDAAAGKRNRATDRPRSVITLMVVAAGAGCTFAWFWRDDLPLLSCYLATWLAFALYSIRPVRLKTRGLAGVLCDAAGEQMCPALAGVFVATRGAERAAGAAWMATIAIWALAVGCRGILWHQLTDVDNDRAAGVRTFAVRQPRIASLAGTFAVFPLELAAFTAMLWQIGGAWPATLLALYALYAIHSARRRHRVPVIVAPRPRSFIVLQVYYSDLFPVALLIAAAVRDRRDLLILVIHLLLFPRRVLHVTRRITSLVGSSIIKRRASASAASTVVNASEPHQGGVG